LDRSRAAVLGSGGMGEVDKAFDPSLQLLEDDSFDVVLRRGALTVEINADLDESKNARDYLAQIDGILPQLGCRAYSPSTEI
jgi:hypothetical protein